MASLSTRAIAFRRAVAVPANLALIVATLFLLARAPDNPILFKVEDPLIGILAVIMLTFVGGVTFLLASFIAISQGNAKRVLAYSTISTLGPMVMCAGVGTYEAAWSALLLILFHAVAKSLLFLCVGVVEYKLGK